VPRANDDVETLLLEYADLLSILSDDPFKPRAYEKAARAVGGYPADVADLDLKGLHEIPSVGRSIAEKIHEYLTTGAILALEELREQIPDGVRQLLGVPGLGPKKAMALYRELHISSVEELLGPGRAGLGDVVGRRLAALPAPARAAQPTTSSLLMRPRRPGRAARWP